MKWKGRRASTNVDDARGRRIEDGDTFSMPYSDL